ncbi:ADP-dependent glucokinase/phosphofructokinase [Treponema sp. OttesenSCG-928-L16]|nr:ADP-dependent glucokinase/phosphofructokinase [Treponema sp. OttesenSCG-928-L16]
MGGILLGLGNNIDYEIVWDTPAFTRMVQAHGIEKREIAAGLPVQGIRDLLISILYFLSTDTGGERFISSPEITETFCTYFDKKITLGGTSIRAAIAMDKLGIPSKLHMVTMNDQVRRLLPERVQWICSSTAENSYPHLIIQFNAGTEIRTGDIRIKTKRPNRIIYTNDPDNEKLLLHPKLSAFAAGSDVFLISGFNAIRDETILRKRLNEMKEVLAGLDGAVVFYEDACFHHPPFSALVREYLGEYIDIHSLNEDELRSYLNTDVNLLDTEDVLDALNRLNAVIGAGTIILHTRYWALAFGENASAYAGALHAGIAMATARLRYGDDFTAAEYEETKRLSPEEEGRAFSLEIGKRGNGSICCVPSLAVQEKDLTTIGLGDAFVGGFLSAPPR